MRQYLDKKDIAYIAQYTIPQLPRKKYDFYVPSTNTLIEYDGRQHFKHVEYFHRTYEYFKERQGVDRLKTDAAITAGHRLVRISHNDIEVIPEILDKCLRGSRPLNLSSPDMYMYLFYDLPDEPTVVVCT